MFDFHWVPLLTFVADLLIRVGFSVRIIKRRLPVGTSLAWLTVVLIFPFAGAVIYLLIGESRLGRNRRSRAKTLRDEYRGVAQAVREAAGVGEPELPPAERGLSRLAEAVLQAPALPGNDIRLLRDASEAF